MILRHPVVVMILNLRAVPKIFLWIWSCYEVATSSRLLKIVGLFCKRALLKRRFSAKETYNFKEPTNRSHPIYSKTKTVGPYSGRSVIEPEANQASIWGGFG